ncbi:hypothetical protein APC96_07950 [Acinetobacter pittii]|uniref:hypothetical protein n=1 Tax=Acinetobacter pittii TaxID=48296 RepID=UPI00070D175B|nr:hypothetical protein [Acinetobacter pittii]KRI16176.1 hypothetical protein APC96_07950 [Acinetobacter pittii]MCG9495843.1 hypothetical protein [Acinetobacter pittii]OOS62836.1 hypothetical protein BTG60_16290 [Acinetobacter pittii]WQD15362.1 hypothetical protein U0544_17620 [Acinetobacter pittii]
MTDLNKESEVNLRFEQDDGAVWVFADDSQFGTEISHLMMMHADEYNEDELRVICQHAACEIDRLRAELEKAKAQAVPEGYVLLPRVPTEKMFQAYERYSVAPMSTLSKTGYKAMVEAASESGAKK